MELQGKVALVTGGGTGLGRAISWGLAQAGMRVAINYSKSQTDAEQTAAELTTLGSEAVTVQADVANAVQVTDMVQTVYRHFGRLDVLIANSGTTVFHPFEALDAVSEEDWDLIMSVNVKGVWLCAKAAAPYLKASGAGRIVVVTSIAGLRSTGSSLPYSVSKAAANHLTRGLAHALAPEVLVNAIAPGLLDTRWAHGHNPQTIDGFLASSPLHRVPTLADCTLQVLTFLRSDSMTGTVVPVDAGMVL